MNWRLVDLDILITAKQGYARREQLTQSRYGLAILPGVQFSIDGEKDILGGIRGSGASGGFSPSILVGLWRNHSNSLCRVVGGLQERVVLRAN
jgi:hypothetical protein